MEPAVSTQSLVQWNTCLGVKFYVGGQETERGSQGEETVEAGTAILFLVNYPGQGKYKITPVA